MDLRGDGITAAQLFIIQPDALAFGDAVDFAAQVFAITVPEGTDPTSVSAMLVGTTGRSEGLVVGPGIADEGVVAVFTQGSARLVGSFPDSGMGTQSWPLQRPGVVTLERQGLAPTLERGSQRERYISGSYAHLRR